MPVTIDGLRWTALFALAPDTFFTAVFAFFAAFAGAFFEVFFRAGASAFFLAAAGCVGFFAANTAAHRFRCASAIFFRASGLNFRFRLVDLLAGAPALVPEIAAPDNRARAARSRLISSSIASRIELISMLPHELNRVYPTKMRPNRVCRTRRALQDVDDHCNLILRAISLVE